MTSFVLCALRYNDRILWIFFQRMDSVWRWVHCVIVKKLKMDFLECAYVWLGSVDIVFTADSRYIAVQYNTLLYIAQLRRWNFGYTSNSRKTPIPHPHRRAMDVFRYLESFGEEWQRDIAVLDASCAYHCDIWGLSRYFNKISINRRQRGMSMVHPHLISPTRHGCTAHSALRYLRNQCCRHTTFQ